MTDDFARMIIVEPDNSTPGWWVWEVSRPDPARPAGRHILAESSARWLWLAVFQALWFAWLSRHDRFSEVHP